MTRSIQLSRVMANGESVYRSYRDAETGDAGSICAGFTSNYVRVSYLGDEEASQFEQGRVERDDPISAQRTVTEELAAVEAIGSVLDLVHGQAAA